MKAAILRDRAIVVDDVPEPAPGPGQVLVETIACGICGSDLHCRLHARDLVAASRLAGMSIFDFDPDRDLVMGHEFSARVLEPGAGITDLVPGTEVVAFPVVQTAAGARAVGYSNDHPGGFAPRLVVDAAGVRPIPDGLDPRLAALTEPAAVGLHAVNRSSLDARSGSGIVLGCGPVGLMTIAALRMKDVPLVVAADLSPARRAMALRIGADVVVDPRDEPVTEAWATAGGEGRPVLFEAVGVPGMIDTAMRAAPAGSQIVVVGLCMQPDSFAPALGISKRLTLTFVLGWTPAEFDASLAGIADGSLDVAPLVTDEVGIDGVADAFDRLADPAEQVKILVRPNGEPGT